MLLNKLNGKTIVVTGASGFIGSILVDELVKLRCKVIRISGKELNPLVGTISINANIRLPIIWNLIAEQADLVYHLAGNTSVYEAANNPSESLNSTLLPINHLVNAAQKRGRKLRIVYASTATVYGLTSKLPVTETEKCNPITIYDHHKLFAEQQLAFASQQNILESVSLRLANVYGPSRGLNSAVDRGILNKITKMALQKKELTVYGNGNYLRDYIFVTDVVNAFLLAGIFPNLNGQSFNIASGIGTTVKQAFDLVAIMASKIVGQPIDVILKSWPVGTDSIEFREFTADISKFIEATKWKPKVKFEDGIALLIKESLKNNENHL
jgi:UDP-glucose 4-epimerase